MSGVSRTSKELGLPEPQMSSGATVLSEFLEEAHVALDAM